MTTLTIAGETVSAYADGRFDVAQGLYWYCADYHDGQWSPEYRVLSTLGYRPGACEHGPQEPLAKRVYRALKRGDVTLDDVRAFVAADEEDAS